MLPPTPNFPMSLAVVRVHGCELKEGHSLSRIAILKGTVNDPTTFPPPSASHGSYHWAFERLLSAGLVPLTAAAFVTSGSNYPILDGILGVSLVVHSHIGVRQKDLVNHSFN